jgi:predicted kinase
MKTKNYIGDLILLRGIPGSGKTTLGELILQSPSNETPDVISADDYFIDELGNYKYDVNKIKEAHNDCQVRCANKMKLEAAKIIVANTFTQEWEMEKYYEMAERYHYRVHSVIVENRHGGKNIHGVKESKLKEMKDRFEVKL